METVIHESTKMYGLVDRIALDSTKKHKNRSWGKVEIPLFPGVKEILWNRNDYKKLLVLKMAK